VGLSLLLHAMELVITIEMEFFVFVSWIHVLVSVGFVQNIMFLYVVHNPVHHCHGHPPSPAPRSYPQLYHLIHLPFLWITECDVRMHHCGGG